MSIKAIFKCYDSVCIFIYLFQALIVEGKKELKKRLVRARIDCISFAFLRLYGLLSPTSGGTRSDRGSGVSLTEMVSIFGSLEYS